MSLSYVFWHCPRDGVDPGEYEQSLRDFHRKLGELAVPGFGGSWTVRLASVPWLGGRPGSTDRLRSAGSAPHYEDRYLVADFTALGRLNEMATRPAEHDTAARMAERGTAGLYRLIRGVAAPGATAAHWLSKPDGVPYPEFLAGLDIGAAALWQRQMTLGPTPEFQVIGAGDIELSPL